MNLLAGVGIGGGALVLVAAVGVGRTQPEPRQDPHADLACQDCHVTAEAQTIGPAPSGQCITCHDIGDLADSVELADVTFDHFPHAGVEPGLDLSCNACHVHQAEAEPLGIDAGSCFLCHADLQEDGAPPAEATLEAGGCVDCHRNPSHVGTTSNGIEINHTSVVESEIPCLQCHFDVLDGTGSTTLPRCEDCHERPVPPLPGQELAGQSVASAAHVGHLTEDQAVACARCHTPLGHRVVAVASAVALDCEGCHTEEHADSLDHQLQQLFYTGLVPDNPPQQPAAMFLARVACQGCHDGAPADAAMSDQERLASINQACLDCHGAPYGSLLELWQPAMEERTAAVNEYVSTAATAVRDQAGPKADSLVQAALEHARLVTEANGLHNIPAAHAMLRSALDDATRAYQTAGIDPPNSPALGTDPTNVSCARCHYGVEAVSDSVYDQPLRHSDHLLIAEVACEECHSSADYLRSDGRAIDPDHGQTPITEGECLTCHHVEAQVDCVNCHTDLDPADLLPVATISITIGDSILRVRDVSFSHTQHDSVTCATCHATGVTLEVAPTVSDCSDCHEDHHVANRECGFCHVGEEMLAPHAPPLDGHAGCDACHARERVVELAPDSPFCLTCHTDEGDHYPEKSCTSCHLQASIEEYQPYLLRTTEAGE